jgi:glycosyltransferase involved in cell wall biosynthesis
MGPLCSTKAATLAVVIPAFRRRYLAQTLESLARQTATQDEFHVYVADDGSPEDIESIVTAFAPRLNLTYRRFPENLGSISLVRHWHRAIDASTEPWVWLFSDDDEAEPDAVAAVLETIRSTARANPLIRLSLQLIDGEGGSTAPRISYAADQTHAEFLDEHVSNPALYCVIQNFIFSRASYAAAGGFSEHPGGHYTDLSSWPRFARGGGVLSPARGGVRYRVHVNALSQQALGGGRSWNDYLAGMAGFFAAMDSEYRVANRIANPPCPGLRFAAHLLRYQFRRLTWMQMRRVELGALQVWPRMPWSTRVAFWKAVLAPWARHFRSKLKHLIGGPA